MLTQRRSALREKSAEEERYRVLLAKGDHTNAEDAEVRSLQQRAIAIPREKLEWQEKLTAVEAEVARLEMDLEQRRSMHTQIN